MGHFKEVDFRSQRYKVGDKVWTLNGGKRREQYINDIFDDTPFEDSNYVTKCCYTSDCFCPGSKGSFNRLEEVYLDEWSAEHAEQRWKDDYDNYVTRL